MFRHRLVAFLLISIMTCMWKPTAATKFFEKTRHPNGTLTCALDKPSLVIPLDQLLSSLSDGDSCVAPVALCASQCLQDPDCTNYNYRKDLRTCEFFHYTPANCSPMQGCCHVEVIDLQSCQIAPVAETSTKLAVTSSGWSLDSSLPATSTTFRGLESSTSAITIVPPPTITSGLVCDQVLSSPNYLMQANFGYGLDQDWQAYKYGFSDANGGYYIGNENLYRMTNNGYNWNLCLDAVDKFGVQLYKVFFTTFVLNAETVGYTFYAKGQEGSPIDILAEDSGMYKFTTKDKNNHPCCCENQAQICKGGWWWSCSGGGTAVVNGAGPCGFYYHVTPTPSVQFKRTYIRISQK